MDPVTPSDVAKLRANPVPSNARNPTLDIIRGFALLGMIIAHVHKIMGSGIQATGLERGIEWVTTWGIAEKDRAIFAFMFGVGFAVFIRRLESKPIPLVSLFLRRLFVLYLFGFAVETLTQFVILREYAWWGIPLLWVRHWSTRSLLALALFCASAFSIREVAAASYDIIRYGRNAAVVMESAQIQQLVATRETETELLSTLTYSDVVSRRAHQNTRNILTVHNFTPSLYLGLFIIGLLAVRHGIFDEPRTRTRIIAAAMAIGLFSWLAYWFGLPFVGSDVVTPRIAHRLRNGLGLLDEQYLAFTYVGAIILLLEYRPAWRRWLAGLGWAGRMALTNYILQAIIIEFVAADYALGLKIRPLLEPVAAVILFGLQVVLSRVWLSHFLFGPFEWAWRSLTYWRWQPIRVPRESGVSPLRTQPIS